MTWNLEHLAERNGEGCRPRSDADYAALRAHAVALGADVIAFQEVESRATAERVFDPASYDVVMSARPQTRRGDSCYGAPGQQIRHQGVGFAVRKGLRWTRHTDFSALGLGNPDLRWGVDITIEGRRPLRLLGVHLKSGCNSGNAPTDRDCPVLFSQLPVLERWIDARAGEGYAFAVLGDWNRRIAARGDAFYSEIDDGDPVGADLDIAGGRARGGLQSALSRVHRSHRHGSGSHFVGSAGIVRRISLRASGSPASFGSLPGLGNLPPVTCERCARTANDTAAVAWSI
ncbi:endonuclease/exonuclease/phosphatase family protein [Sphingomonas sp. J315]|uniref:endonuclease/exonuclease/phosphatase family protein n=1 Tax=Sphingomonas sp. J315 TaxID=2898433 RepID=UPI0021AD6D73|nr:endonuclease/exonuclease/phosphatase family protein [Sphingomonas sp. J315]UUX98722.1 endonuclease/exonuclease/phosphatase family protein [Sphingomonas sp. J315]